jgi:UMF1 family MFS transporter
VFEKFSGIFGPLLFALVIALGGTSRYGILSVIVFFIAGIALLTRVDVDAGKTYAKEAERLAHAP